MTSQSHLTSFDIHVIARELDVELGGYYIGKIYQVNASTVLFKLNKPACKQRLLIIEAGRRLHLTTYDVAKPEFPSQFCSALRKHLLNGRIERVEQQSFERIVTLTIRRGPASYTLVAEVFPRGSIVLLDSNGVILHSLLYRRMRDRDITRGSTYKPPPPMGLDPRQATITALESLRKQSTEAVKALAKTLATGGLYAEEFLAAAGVDKKLPASKLTDQQLASLHAAIQETLRKLDNPQPRVVLTPDGSPVAVAPFQLAAHEGLKFKTFKSHNEAADECFTHIAAAEETEKQKRAVSEADEKLTRILEEQYSKAETLRKAAETNRALGEIIQRNSPRLSELLRWVNAQIQAGMRSEEISSEASKIAELGPVFRGFDPAEKKVTAHVEGQEFTLSLKKSLFQNASDYFDEAKRLKEKLASVEKVREDIISRKKTTELQMRGVEAKAPGKIRDKKWFEKYNFFTSSEDFLVVGGRDAPSNEALLKRYGEPADIVFHAEVPGAAFVVVKTEGRTPGEATMKEAAQFAAVHSRAWKEGLAATDIYWVNHTQLSKQAPPGQFLPRGAFMVYGERNYMRRVPLQLAVGVKLNTDLTFVAGPPSAVRKHTAYAVELTPGTQPAKELAPRIKQTLSRMVPKKDIERTLKVNVEQLKALIPFGSGHLQGGTS